jgi:cytochrome c oxidase assembly protein subunit 15
MTDPVTPTSARLVRVFAILAVVSAALLLLVGGLVTSWRAGMADPGWPRSPTYIAEDPKVWQPGNRGLLVEHSHRALGFLTGGFASLLALSAWWTEPRRGLRWAGLAAVLALLVVYGQFHREMGVAWKAREQALDAGEAPGAVLWPKTTAVVCGVAALAVLGVAAASFAAGGRWRWVRLLVSVGLIAVMIQGLLGGFRVFLDQIMGTQLAAIHGAFAQLVFCVLLSVVVLSTPLRPEWELPTADRDRFGLLAILLPAAVVVQLVWGVMVRHTGTPLGQRLHILTAFVVTGLAVWLAARVLATPAGRARLGFYAYHLVAIVAVQVLLGVEAWMGKFAAAGPEMATAPMQRSVTEGAAYFRTAHMLVGVALLAASVLLAFRVWRRADVGVIAEAPAKPTLEPVAAA